MSTRCRIGIQNPNGTITSIYCHHDGYPAYVGKCLVDFYTDEDKIRKLMELGDMSALGTEPVDAGSDAWKLMAQHDDAACVTYKARGEECPARTHNSVEQYYDDTGECWGEYAYLYKDGEWYIVQDDQTLIAVKDTQGYKTSVFFKAVN